MVLLYGRAGRLTAKNGGFRPGQSKGLLMGFYAGNCICGEGGGEGESVIKC